MLDVKSLRKKVSEVTGISIEKLSVISWDEFDKTLSPLGWNSQRTRGGLVTGVCEPLSQEDIDKIRKKAEKILNSF
ncbi:hypothetical protein FJY90_00630 [Candidatus Gottesmanbacteria bacterium]|nr:hypothetical protein [Candidatus Gottesmanbacteria bacterium]